jgi:hypothetical protein
MKDVSVRRVARPRPGWDSRHNPIGKAGNRVPTGYSKPQPVVIHKPEPKRKKYVPACEGKVRYSTCKAAEGALAEFLHNHPTEQGMHAYSCQRCAGYHLGHSREHSKGAGL